MTIFAGLAAILSLAFADPAADCGAPDGAAGLLQETEGRILLVGEMHGTNETPAMVARLVCLALANGESVALGLEIGAAEEARIEAYLASDGGEAARAALLYGSAFWDSPFKDGRSSAAMLDLIDRARREIASGAALAVRPVDFDRERDADLADYDMGEARDRAMARRARALQADFDRVIYLVGNIHARRTPFTWEGVTRPTIGSLLDGGEFISVNVVFSGGHEWNCRPECAVHPTGAFPLEGDPRVLDAADHGMAGRYDYVIYAGVSTPSLPALPAREAEAQD